MSSIDLTDRQRRVLEELAADQPSDLATVAELRRWGWVMPGSLDLAGAGLAHAETGPPRLL